MTVRGWMVPYQALTPEQNRIVRLPTSTHQLVVGPAGSGKTILLLHRASYLTREVDVSASGLRVLVYTNVLRTYITSGVDSMDLPTSLVQTFFAWVYELARRNFIRLPDVPERSELFPHVLRTVREEFEKRNLPPELEVALVDEGQDLTPDAHRLLAKAARHVTVFADYSQQLYRQAASCREAMQALGIDNLITLVRSVRTAGAVMGLAAQFLAQGEQQMFSLSGACEGSACSSRLPLLFRARSAVDEWDGLAAVILNEVHRNARVGILLPNNAMVHTVWQRLSEMGVATEEIVASQPSFADFNDLTPKVLTIYSAKGLSFDTVMIPRLVRSVWRGSPAPIPKALFVGMTRAMEWVYLSTVMGLEPPELGCVDDLIQEGQVIEKRGRFLPGTEPAVSIADEFPL